MNRTIHDRPTNWAGELFSRAVARDSSGIAPRESTSGRRQAVLGRAILLDALYETRIL